MKEEIQVTGRVYVLGNEPCTQRVVQMDDGRIYALTWEYDKQLCSFQGKHLFVVGKPGARTVWVYRHDGVRFTAGSASFDPPKIP